MPTWPLLIWLMKELPMVRFPVDTVRSAVPPEVAMAVCALAVTAIVPTRTAKKIIVNIMSPLRIYSCTVWDVSSSRWENAAGLAMPVLPWI
jgi:hypothetical protein